MDLDGGILSGHFTDAGQVTEYPPTESFVKIRVNDAEPVDTPVWILKVVFPTNVAFTTFPSDNLIVVIPLTLPKELRAEFEDDAVWLA